MESEEGKFDKMQRRRTLTMGENGRGRERKGEEAMAGKCKKRCICFKGGRGREVQFFIR